MSLYKQFKTDAKLEKEGLTLDFGDGVTMLVARAGGSNDRYAKRMEVLSKPYRRQIESGTVDRKVLERVVIEVFAETVVLGWNGVTDEDGKPLEFNRINAIKVFTDLPDLFAEVQEQASKSALFRLSLNEQDAKN